MQSLKLHGIKGFEVARPKNLQVLPGGNTHIKCAALLKDEEEFLEDFGKVIFLSDPYQKARVRGGSSLT